MLRRTLEAVRRTPVGVTATISIVGLGLSAMLASWLRLPEYARATLDAAEVERPEVNSKAPEQQPAWGLRYPGPMVVGSTGRVELELAESATDLRLLASAFDVAPLEGIAGPVHDQLWLVTPKATGTQQLQVRFATDSARRVDLEIEVLNRFHVTQTLATILILVMGVVSAIGSVWTAAQGIGALRARLERPHSS